MPSNYNTISINQIYVNESPLVFLVDSTPIFNFNYLGTGTMTTATNVLYRNKEDVTATGLSSGNATITGRIVTTAQLTLSIPGEYELYVKVFDGAIARRKALRILVRKLGVF